MAKATSKKAKIAKAVNFDQIKSFIDASEDDVRKFAEGTQAPASRIRKALQNIIIVAKQMRKDVIEIKNGRK